ncbi:amino acid adenylation domain-containing protein [Streptomyces sp. NPDC048639]|uniref:non-ribosomal peptide synthetase n=1 Tax=Streptomyces sp. NPDC048639 TaxID=3365581 RepID=UPI003719994F
MIQQNDGPAGAGPATTLHALYESCAELYPDKTAVVTADETLTYGALNAQANRLAWRLQELGVGPNTLVGICVERSARMIVGLLGILKAGGAYVPFDPGYPAERLEFMLRDSAVPVMVTQSRLVASLPDHEAAIVLLDEDSTYPTENPPTIGVSDLAYVIYTSGSTGTPKGVLVPHEGVVNLVTEQTYVSITPEDRVAALATLSFDASTFEIWGPLVNGAACVVYTFDGIDLSNLCDQVRQDAVSILHLTSPVFRLLDHKHFESLAGVHTLLFGGDSIRAQLVETAKESFAGRLIHLYGPTETTGFATFQDVRADAQGESTTPIGGPIARVHVRVLGPDGEQVAEGQPGELFIGGRGMTRGYLNRPELTAERFVPDTHGTPGTLLYRSGDLVLCRPDGAIRFLGRSDRQVKVRGYRIEPGEIEAALIKHPMVNDAVVVAREDGSGDKRLDAYVVASHVSVDSAGDSAREGSNHVEARRLVTELRQLIVEALPRHHHPASITVISAIPLTANLKLDLSKLPAPAEERGLTQEAVVNPRSELEAALALMWGTTLGLAEVGIDDSFFEIGGDSISAVQMAAATTQRAAVPVTVRDILKFPTIRQLSALVSERVNCPEGNPLTDPIKARSAR